MSEQKLNPILVRRGQREQSVAMAPAIQVVDPRLLGGGKPEEELRTVVTVADLVRYVTKRWKVSLGLAALLAGGVFLLLAGKVPQYESEARVLVKMQGNKVFNFDRVVDNQIPEFSAPALLNNHRAEMGTQKFREFMAGAVDAEVKERFVSDGGVEVPLLATVVGGVKGAVKWVVGAEREAAYAPGDGGEALDEAFSGKLFRQVKIDMVKETHILRVLVRHESAAIAAEVANVYADAYMSYVSVQDSEMTQSASEFLTQQADDLRKQVEASERELLEYRQQEGLVESDERLGVSADRRKLLNNAISQAKIELAQLKQSLAQVKTLEGMRPEELAVRAITTYPGVEELHRQVISKLQEKALLDARYKEKHPKMVAFVREFDALTKSFSDQVVRAASELENTTSGLEARIADLSGQLGDAEGEVLAMGDKNIKQSMLRSQLEADRSLYDKMVVRLNEASVSSQLKDASHLRLSEKATAGEKAVSPNVVLATVFSGMLFCGFFIGFPVVIGMGEDLVRGGGIGVRPEDKPEPGPVREALAGVEISRTGEGRSAEVAMLGALPEMAGAAGSAIDLVHATEGSGEFDALATEIESRVAGERNRSVYLVTSERAGVGKSTVAAGLGMAFGRRGKKTLVVDANLRAPAMEGLFDMRGAQGLAPWLSCDGANSFDLEKLRQPGTSLYVLPAGLSDEEPSSLLSKECFGRLMAGAMDCFDRVIVDAPPADECPELFALLPHVGGVLAVSELSGELGEAEVAGLAGRLGLDSTRLLGAVVNRAGGLAAARAA